MPQLTDSGFRDSGVYVAVLGVNLRDQVRLDDSVPLQFKYEAADCRIFYTLDNVYNMSRLWRDTVTAAFDDPSLCVEGSTGFSGADKAAPEPMNAESFNPNFDFSEPDSSLIDDNLDLSGGPQDKSTQAVSSTIGPCLEGDTCKFINQRCLSVKLRVCDTLDQTTDAFQCVPHQGPNTICPVGTSWKPITADTLRLKEQTSRGSGRAGVVGNNQPAAQVSTGACMPAIGSNSVICSGAVGKPCLECGDADGDGIVDGTPPSV